MISTRLLDGLPAAGAGDSESHFVVPTAKPFCQDTFSTNAAFLDWPSTRSTESFSVTALVLVVGTDRLPAVFARDSVTTFSGHSLPVVSLAQSEAKVCLTTDGTWLSFGPMKQTVFGLAGEQLPVANGVVRSCSIFVVDDFRRCEIPSSMAFNYQPVFADIPSAIPARMVGSFDQDVAIRAQPFFADTQIRSALSRGGGSHGGR